MKKPTLILLVLIIEFNSIIANVNNDNYWVDTYSNNID